jgi:two-component system chemotaxis sensor kinase CheA
MAGLSHNQRNRWLPIAAAAACSAVLAALLFSGVRLAARLQTASTALQLASTLSSQPQFLRSELTLIQRGLETRTYVGNSLRALDASRVASNQAYSRLAFAMRHAGIASGSEAATLYARALDDWRPLDAGLARLATVDKSGLYADSASGSTLTSAGAALKRTVDELLAAQTRATTALESELGALAAQLRETVVHDGGALRGLLLGGAGLASLLLAAMLYFALRAGRAAEAAAEAERQVGNLLGTVREGLFLIARDGRIGSAHSDSLPGLLHVPVPAGQSFAELLRPLVDDKTLLAATKYLGLLHKDKVNEELIESVNPLGQIEVSLPRAQGPAERRFLSFSFRRARGAQDLVFGAVADVTERVLLQRELEQLRTDQDSQAALLLQLLKAGPLQLHSFLNNVEVGVRRCNALLRSPGTSAPELQKKLEGVFREMHALKGEAAALGLQSFVQRAHQVEDLLDALRSRPELGGDDFVPAVVRLDELVDHMQLVASMQEQLVHAHSMAKHVAEVPPERHGDTAVLAPGNAPAAALAPVPAPAPGLELSLQRLAGEITASGERTVRVVCEGLERVPTQYQAPVRDLCIQLVRNAIVHGIEPSAARAAAGKPPVGTVRVRFSDANEHEYSLLVEDDGQGLSPDRIRERALERGLLDAQQAAALDRSGAYRLIFRSGFSTAQEVTEHAGRGVGLDVVNATVRACGGRIGLATANGQYTRFKAVLPRRATLDAAASTAA